MKEKVNLAFLSYLTGPLNGGADDDKMIESYWEVDPNDESTIKNIIKSKLLSAYEVRPMAFKRRVKLALSYVLSLNKNLGSEYDSNLLPFDHPDNPNLFYKWLWEVFFPNEKFTLPDLSLYEEIRDWTEPLNLSIEDQRRSAG